MPPAPEGAKWAKPARVVDRTVYRFNGPGYLPQGYSLLSVVKNVKTPTMVLTGEEDYRTPMSESEQYYQALKLLGVESVLVRVPDEPHGIRRYPSHWMAKMLYITEWFEKYRTEADISKTD